MFLNGYESVEYRILISSFACRIKKSSFYTSYCKENGDLNKNQKDHQSFMKYFKEEGTMEGRKRE